MFNCFAKLCCSENIKRALKEGTKRSGQGTGCCVSRMRAPNSSYFTFHLCDPEQDSLAFWNLNTSHVELGKHEERRERWNEKPPVKRLGLGDPARGLLSPLVLENSLGVLSFPGEGADIRFHISH